MHINDITIINMPEKIWQSILWGSNTVGETTKTVHVGKENESNYDALYRNQLFDYNKSIVKAATVF